MTRQNIIPNPEQRLFEAYMSFAGGHNSEISNDLLKDYEFPVLENVDLSGRGTAKRRTGRELFVTLPFVGQGHFQYYRVSTTEPDHIFAAGGRLYLRNSTNSTSTEIPILDNGSTFTFQTSREVEAVQYGTSLYVATGSKLVSVTFNETTQLYDAITVTPYAPNTQEVMFIGTNGLADNPSAYISEGVTANLQIAGIIPENRSGVVNNSNGFTAYINKPGTMTNVDYKWEYRMTGSTTVIGAVNEVSSLVITSGCTTNGDVVITLDGIPYTVTLTTTAHNTATLVAGAIRSTYYYGWITGGTGTTVTFAATDAAERADTTYSKGSTGANGSVTTTTVGKSGTTWKTGRDWTAGSVNGKQFNLLVDTPGKYDLQVTVRDNANQTVTAVQNVSSYQIDTVMNKANILKDVSGIKTCNRIRLHWDRLLLFGDTQNPFLMYISDLQAPTYYPTNLVLSFDTGKLEAINSVVRFQDYLVVMTNTTIQTLIGKDPDTYARYLIHDTIGCIAPRSATVVGNQILFLAYNGIMSLRPNPYRIEALNVRRTDIQIHKEIMDKLDDKDVCGMYHENQYWICFPASNTIYRYYFEQDVWVRDKSNKLNIAQFTSYGGRAYNMTKGANVFIHNEDTWTDDGEVFDMVIDAKMYDLGYSFNNKKLRRMYVLAKHFDGNTNLYVKVYSDSTIIVTPDSGKVIISEDGLDTTWVTTSEPNMHFYAGTHVGYWILSVNPLGDIQVSVQKMSLQGKCRRVKVNIRHSDNAPCEIYGFGFEFKLKKV